MTTALEAVRGDTITLVATVTRDDAAVNCTAASVWFTLKLKSSDPDPGICQKTKAAGAIVVSGAGSNILTITVAAADTAGIRAPETYQWDIQIKEAGGTVTTVATGTLKLAADVTHAVV